MEWLWGLAILPALLCGLMCVGGVVLAAVGIRRTTGRRACCDEPLAGEAADDETMTVER